MEESQIVLRLFVPSDQQAAEAVHPRMCSFYHPPRCLETSIFLDGFGFFSTPTNVSSKAEFAQGLTYSKELPPVLPLTEQYMRHVTSGKSFNLKRAATRLATLPDQTLWTLSVSFQSQKSCHPSC